MVSKTMMRFAKAIKKNDPDRARELTGKVLREKYESEAVEGLQALPGVGPDRAKKIQDFGYRSIESLAGASLEDLTKVPGLGEESAKEILDAARELQGPAKKIAGYRRALEGIVSALESGQEMALAGRIAGGSYSKERLLGIGEEMKLRASQEFRPYRERGYSEAWADVLEALT